MFCKFVNKIKDKVNYLFFQMYMFFIPLLNSAIPTPQHPREHNIYSY